MFNKTNTAGEKSSNGNGNGTTIINSGTVLRGDIESNNDIRIDGTIIGNITCKSKIVIGVNGSVEGNIEGNQADIVGNVTGNLFIKDLLQLRGEGLVNGDVQAGKLQVEPTATFNGQCKMNGAAHGKTKGLPEISNITSAKFTVDRSLPDVKTAAK